MAAATALPIVGALVIAHFVQLVIDGAPLADVAPYGLGYAAIGLVSASFGLLVTWRSTALAWQVTNQLRNDLVGQVLEADLSFHRDRTPGELLTRCDADVTSLTTFLASVVARIIGIVMLAVASTVVLAAIEPRLAAVLAVGYSALGWTMWKVKDLSADAVLAERTIDAEMNSVAEQYLAGAEDVASLGAGRHGLRRFGDAAARLVDAAGLRVRDEMRVQSSIKGVIAIVMLAVLAVGGPGVALALEERGLVPVTSAADGPAAVMMGFGPDVSWRALAEAAYAVGSGAVFVATNTDTSIPTARGIAPGNGTLVGAVQAATGRAPVVAGKPYAPLMRESVERVGARRPLVVGDRLDTDMKGARAVGIASMHVLTGVDRPKQLVAASSDMRPDFIVETLEGLHEPYPETVVEKDGTAKVGTARVRMEGHIVKIVDRGDSQINLLRAGCAAIWASGLAIYGLQVPGELYEDHWR